MLKSLPRCIAIGLTSLAIIGCGQAPAPVKPSAVPISAPIIEAVAETNPAPQESALPAVTPTVTADVKTSSPFAEGALRGESVVGLVVIHPRRLHASVLYATLRDTGLLQDFEKQLASENIKLETIERAILVIDQAIVNNIAGAAGLEVPEGGDSAQEAIELNVINHLDKVFMAMQMYHHINHVLPRADGDGAGIRTGLSWRVHLLPFLGERDLYNEFHLEEPWDSDHNKALIERMPAIFNTPGVAKKGMTSLHVFVGEKAPFHGDKGRNLDALTDGISDTVLAVLAGTDTADVWTKPGGLKFDGSTPKKMFGDVEEQVPVVMFDGTIRKLSMEIPDAELASLIQPADGNPVSVDLYSEGMSPESSRPVPTAILSLAAGVDRKSMLTLLTKVTEEEIYEGQTLHKNPRETLCFFDDKTVLLGSPTAVKKLIDRRKVGRPTELSLVKQIAADADFAVALNLKPQTMLLEQAVQSNPMLSMLQQTNELSLEINLTSKPGDKLLEVVVTAVDPQAAVAIAELANGGLREVKALIQMTPPLKAPQEKRLQEFIQEVGQSAEVQQVANRIEFLIPVPEGFDQLPEILKQSLEKVTQAATAKKTMNTLKQLALSFHNYHEVNGALPGAGRAATAMGKKGLSWRVHLLPFLEEEALYKQFNFDEPWDSETNKALIEQMPEIFKTEGVTEAGKTSIHVFTGKGALFADDSAPSFAEVTDGLSKTILTVYAGPETAEIWTKPGGLDFDPENPVKAVGQTGDLFCAGLADGSVRWMTKRIKPETLRRLIQSADGETITDEF